jgi:hypothetical protein
MKINSGQNSLEQHGIQASRASISAKSSEVRQEFILQKCSRPWPIAASESACSAGKYLYHAIRNLNETADSCT